MSVWLLGRLEPERYWDTVRALADELLVSSGTPEWTIFVRTGKPLDAWGEPVHLPDADGRWYVAVRWPNKELTVAVPDGPAEAADGAPEDVATHIVLDLLDELVAGEAGRR